MITDSPAPAPSYLEKPVILNANARVDLRRIGREGHPLLVIDEVLAQPEELIDEAKRATFSRPDHTRYPGLNAALPANYSQAIMMALRPMLERGFGIPRHLPLKFFGFFALATQAAEDLEPIQKVPHHDSPDPFRIAMVHYLCHNQKGGTGFFRHLATGFEGVDMKRRPFYAETAAAELEAGKDRLTHHVTTETPNFEMIDHADIVFNRLVVYRSHVLHAGLLDEATLSDDPATGRLTANSFIEVARPA